VILIGLDGAIPEFIEKFIEDLPNIHSLIESGVFIPALSSPPVDTPTNWTTIATGSWMGTHGINSFLMRLPGDDYNVKRYTFNSNLCQAEYIWETLEKNGKRSILVNYPVAFPVRVKRQIVIGGDGPLSHEWTVGNPALYVTLGSNKIKELGLGFGASIKVLSFKRAEGWRNLPQSFREPLESIMPMDVGVPSKWGPYGPIIKRENRSMKGAVYHILMYASTPEGYDTIVISPEKDLSKAFAVLHEGEWSGWIYDNFAKDGETVEASFQFKLISISKDGKHLILYRSDCFVSEGWSYPKGLAREIIKNVGPFHEGWEICILAHHRLRWVDVDVALEHSSMQADWISKCCGYLARNYRWDLLAAQIHIQDFYNHYCLSTIEPSFPGYDEDVAARSWRIFREAYKITDRMIGEIVRNCADKDTVTIIVSDHGGLPVKLTARIAHLLMKEGLVVYKKISGDTYQIDWRRTKIFSGNWGFWVNLEGREPHGTVKPGEEYEEVRDKLISILHAIRDPESNRPLVRLALRREDARMLGMWGDHVEDVVFFAEPGYVIEEAPIRLTITPDHLGEDEVLHLPPPSSAGHGGYLPNAKLGECSNQALFIMSGSGVEGGKKLDETINLVDVAPTISYLLGIPPPGNSEGRILHEFIEI